MEQVFGPLQLSQMPLSQYVGLAREAYEKHELQLIARELLEVNGPEYDEPELFAALKQLLENLEQHELLWRLNDCVNRTEQKLLLQEIADSGHNPDMDYDVEFMQGMPGFNTDRKRNWIFQNAHRRKLDIHIDSIYDGESGWDMPADPDVKLGYATLGILLNNGIVVNKFSFKAERWVSFSRRPVMPDGFKADILNEQHSIWWHGRLIKPVSVTLPGPDGKAKTWIFRFGFSQDKRKIMEYWHSKDGQMHVPEEFYVIDRPANMCWRFGTKKDQAGKPVKWNDKFVSEAVPVEPFFNVVVFRVMFRSDAPRFPKLVQKEGKWTEVRKPRRLREGKVVDLANHMIRDEKGNVIGLQPYFRTLLHDLENVMDGRVLRYIERIINPVVALPHAEPVLETELPELCPRCGHLLSKQDKAAYGGVCEDCAMSGFQSMLA